MKIIILGTGTPNIRAGSSAIIEVENNILLFDCGRWITLKLSQAKIRPNQVTHFFFTHIFHWDHTCNYYDFLMSVRPGKINIYGPPGTKEYTEKLLELHSKFGEGRAKPILDWAKNHTTDVEKDVICSGNNWKVTAVNIDQNTRWRPTIVYRVEHRGFSTVVAWDVHPRHDLHKKISRFWEYDDSYTSRKNLMDLMEGADLVIADVMKGHTTPEGVGIGAEKAKVKKLVLTHYGSEDQIDELERIKKVFNGKVVIGEDLMNISL